MKHVLVMCTILLMAAPLFGSRKVISPNNLNGVKVQFKNVATGEYVTLLRDPRGGGSLQLEKAAPAKPWHFYQAAGAKATVEVKRSDLVNFNWSNYDNRVDARSFIAWNHAKRIGGIATPKAPHAWQLEVVKPGVFRMKWTPNGEYLEAVGKRVITRALNKSSKHQQWILEIPVKKVKVTHLQKFHLKNVGTGLYATLLADPRGGGSLVGKKAPDATPWYFYKAGNAAINNVEVKRDPVKGFNWSNYDNRVDGRSFIAWNHAKRHPSATTPNAPHSWFIEAVKPGVVQIRFGHNNEYLEMVPSLPLASRAGKFPRVISRAYKAGNKNQHWMIVSATATSQPATQPAASILGKWLLVSVDGKAETGVIVFNANNTGSFKIHNKESTTTYTLSGKSLKLKVDGKVEDLEVKTLTATQLVIYDKNNKITIIFKK